MFYFFAMLAAKSDLQLLDVSQTICVNVIVGPIVNTSSFVATYVTLKFFCSPSVLLIICDKWIASISLDNTILFVATANVFNAWYVSCVLLIILDNSSILSI